MPKGTQERIVPRRLQTLGGMVAESVRVRCWCRKCSTVLEVDPRSLMAVYGSDYSLLGREHPCAVVGCQGTVFYLANGYGRLGPLS